MNALDHADTPEALLTQDIAGLMQMLGRKAKLASAQVARAQAATKNRALTSLAGLLRQNTDQLAAANQQDLAQIGRAHV